MSENKSGQDRSGNEKPKNRKSKPRKFSVRPELQGRIREMTEVTEEKENQDGKKPKPRPDLQGRVTKDDDGRGENNEPESGER